MSFLGLSLYTQGADNGCPMRLNPPVVKNDSLEPAQIRTNIDFKTAINFYQRFLIKAPELCEFHSLAELYFAGLCEGDPHVIRYVIHPYRFWIGRRRYIPDIHVVRDDRRRQVFEIRENKAFDEGQKML